MTFAFLNPSIAQPHLNFLQYNLEQVKILPKHAYSDNLCPRIFLVQYCGQEDGHTHKETHRKTITPVSGFWTHRRTGVCVRARVRAFV